jgi:predicted NUDIX family NTP pyrophosphohydrolase
LLYRGRAEQLMVLLVHPGGPFWRHKDAAAWSIPKGEIDPGEAPDFAATREFEEETGYRPEGPLMPLGETLQAGGKRVLAFALEGDLDPTLVRSGTFELEWPPRSGRLARFPEVDRAAWFSLPIAREKIIAAQSVFLDRLRAILPACRSG